MNAADGHVPRWFRVCNPISLFHLTGFLLVHFRFMCQASGCVQLLVAIFEVSKEAYELGT